MPGSEGKTADLPIQAIEIDRLAFAASDGGPEVATILVHVHLADGTGGLGECRDELGRFVAMQEHAPALLRCRVFDLHALWDAWAGDPGQDAGCAAMGAAWLDAQARHLGWPLWRLLGSAPPAPPAVAARLVLDGNLESVVATADRLLREGSTSAVAVDCSGDPASLLPLLEHVRGQHGAELPVRIDFGGALPESVVLELATAAAAFWPEAVIDPSSTLAGAARLREKLVAPVALRRTVPGPVELATALRLDAVDIWQADMAVIGGPEAFRKGAAVARAFNLDIGLAATGLTEIGAALALHLAATTPLATGAVELHPRLLDPRGLVAGGLRVEAGKAVVPPGPGLGVEVDAMKIAAARIDGARVALAP